MLNGRSNFDVLREVETYGTSGIFKIPTASWTRTTRNTIKSILAQTDDIGKHNRDPYKRYLEPYFNIARGKPHHKHDQTRI